MLVTVFIQLLLHDWSPVGLYTYSCLWSHSPFYLSLLQLSMLFILTLCHHKTRLISIFLNYSQLCLNTSIILTSGLRSSQENKCPAVCIFKGIQDSCLPQNSSLSCRKLMKTSWWVPLPHKPRMKGLLARTQLISVCNRREGKRTMILEVDSLFLSCIPGYRYLHVTVCQHLHSSFLITTDWTS